MGFKRSASLRRICAESGERAGTVWTLSGSDELNANLVRFPVGRGVGEHVNDAVDVLLVGVSGSGAVVVDGEGTVLDEGALVFVPKGVRRSIRSTSEDFAYLSVHRQRGALWIGRKPEDE